MLTDKSPPEELQKRYCRGLFNQCVYCPVSPPDGTARPGQMSDCFFDFSALQTDVHTLASSSRVIRKSTGKKIMIKICAAIQLCWNVD